MITVSPPRWPQRIGCPCGCKTKRPYLLDPDCVINRPYTYDWHLYNRGAVFVPDRDHVTRLTCARRCRGACSLRDTA